MRTWAGLIRKYGRDDPGLERELVLLRQSLERVVDDEREDTLATTLIDRQKLFDLMEAFVEGTVDEGQYPLLYNILRTTQVYINSRPHLLLNQIALVQYAARFSMVEKLHTELKLHASGAAVGKLDEWRDTALEFSRLKFQSTAWSPTFAYHLLVSRWPRFLMIATSWLGYFCASVSTFTVKYALGFVEQSGLSERAGTWVVVPYRRGIADHQYCVGEASLPTSIVGRALHSVKPVLIYALSGVDADGMPDCLHNVGGDLPSHASMHYLRADNLQYRLGVLLQKYGGAIVDRIMLGIYQSRWTPVTIFFIFVGGFLHYQPERRRRIAYHSLAGAYLLLLGFSYMSLSTDEARRHTFMGSHTYTPMMVGAMAGLAIALLLEYMHYAISAILNSCRQALSTSVIKQAKRKVKRRQARVVGLFSRPVPAVTSVEERTNSGAAAPALASSASLSSAPGVS